MGVVHVSAKRSDEAGAVAVLVAVCAVVLFVLAGIVVDVSQARDVRRQSQNSADAAALAGANVLYPDGSCQSPSGGQPPCVADAVATVKTYAESNFGVKPTAWGDSTVCTSTGKPTSPSTFVTPSGAPPCIAFDSLTTTQKVWVSMPVMDVKTGFGALAGKSSITVSSMARATVNQLPPDECGLCFLGSVDAENADFTVYGSSIRVNGDVTAGPNSDWTIPDWTVTGGTIGVVGTVAGGNFTPPPIKTPAFSDPLAGLSLPFNTSSLTVKTNPCGSGGGSGIYNQQISLGNNVNCVLSPGLYVINSTWTIGNNTVVSGSGVTLYTKAPNGYLDFKNGYASISAPTTGTYADLAIIYDRNNVNNLSIQGNGNTQITGTVYLPASKLDFNGNSCFGFDRGPVVVQGVVKANGNKACIKVTNSNGATIKLPPGQPSLDQ